jgi:hypothetical protein
VYSRSDEVVRWEACLDPAAIPVELDVSHLGMGLDARVWSVVRDRLAQAVRVQAGA